MKIIIQNGRVLDPSSRLDRITDIVIEDGKIKKIGKAASSAVTGADNVIDARGKTVCPGFIDMHAHLREPGFEYKETIQSASEAAAAGGFTTIVSMANTRPVADDASIIKFIADKALSQACVNVLPVGAVTKGLQGQMLAELCEMADAGAIAFSDDGHSIMNAQMMRLALEYSRITGRAIICHEEDTTLSNNGSMNEGYMSTVLGVRPFTAMAEETMLGRDIALVRKFGGRLHIAHVSSHGSVQLIRQAKKEKLPITCEVTPHHFTLTDEAVSNYDPNTKMSPPLRTQKDVNALVDGLADGTIDVIATDHAPHAEEEKNVEFDSAAFGITGLETAFPLTYTQLVRKQKLTLAQAIFKLTAAPARILGIPKGTLAVGRDADIVILDLSKTFTFDKTQSKSKSQNTPFHGWRLQGLPVMTMVNGRIVHNLIT